MNIQKYLDTLKKLWAPVNASEIRMAIHDALETMGNNVRDNIGRQTEVEKQFQQVIDETTGKDVISAPEIIAARDGEPNLKAKIDKNHNEVTAQLAQTRDNVRSLVVKPTAFGEVEKSFKDMNSYNAWPNDTLFYDDETGEFVMFTTSKSRHGGVLDAKTYMTKKKGYEDWSEPILVAEGDEERGRRSNGAGMLLNGNYLVITTEDNESNQGNIRLYESSDKGETWADRLLLVDGEPVYSYDCCDFLITQTGRILTWTVSPSYVNHVLYSDDNGQTWEKSLVPNAIGNSPLEGNFCQLSNGVIIAYARATIVGDYQTKRPAVFTRSFDGGTTWQPLQWSESILDMTENNCSFVYNKHERTVEVFVASRYEQPDGYGSIYYYKAHEEDALDDDFGKPQRIAKGSPTGDFGYPAAAKSPDGLTIVAWYDGVSRFYSSIYHMMGNNAEVPNKNREIEQRFMNLENLFGTTIFNSQSSSVIIEDGTSNILRTPTPTNWEESKSGDFPASNNNRVRVQTAIPIKANHLYTFENQNQDIQYSFNLFYEDGSIESHGWESSTTKFKAEKDGELGIIFRLEDDSLLFASDAHLIEVTIRESTTEIDYFDFLKFLSTRAVVSLINQTDVQQFEQGSATISGPEWSRSKNNSNTRIRTINSVEFSENDRYSFQIDENYKYMLFVFYEDGTKETMFAGFTSDNNSVVFSKAGEFGLVIAKSSDGSLSTNDLSSSKFNVIKNG